MHCLQPEVASLIIFTKPATYWSEFGAVQMRSIKPTDVNLLQTKLPSSKHVFSGEVQTSMRTVSSQGKSKQAPRIAAEAVQVPNNPFLFKRREAVGFGVSFGIVELLSQEKASNAAAEAASSCELTVAPSGLAFCDKVLGYGPEAVKGQLIKAHYVGKLENGKVFDSSYNRGMPLTFRVGVGEVIRGWDEGIIGGNGIPPMLAGGKRSLKIPPELAYGGRGAGCKGGSCIIPPDSVLLFDVEFIGKA